MRKLFMCVLLLAGTLTLQAQIKIGKMKIDTKKAIQAGKDAAGAITLSDKDIANNTFNGWTLIIKWPHRTAN